MAIMFYLTYKLYLITIKLLFSLLHDHCISTVQLEVHKNEKHNISLWQLHNYADSYSYTIKNVKTNIFFG
jgi:hypothetical protein